MNHTIPSWKASIPVEASSRSWFANFLTWNSIVSQRQLGNKRTLKITDICCQWSHLKQWNITYIFGCVLKSLRDAKDNLILSRLIYCQQFLFLYAATSAFLMNVPFLSQTAEAILCYMTVLKATNVCKLTCHNVSSVLAYFKRKTLL